MPMPAPSVTMPAPRPARPTPRPRPHVSARRLKSIVDSPDRWKSVLGVDGGPEEHRDEESEHVGLNEGNEDLEQVDRRRRADRDGPHGVALEGEDQPEERVEDG